MNVHSALRTPEFGCDAPRHLDNVLSVESAIAIARSLVSPIRETEPITLGEACGRVAAGDIHAPRPMPFFDQSAMDGFAVRLADLAGKGPFCLRVTNTIAAGDRVLGRAWEANSASRIYTGAPLPSGADAVVMIEDCDDEGGFVLLGRRPRVGENIRPRGSDIERNAVLVAAGTRLEPHHLGLLAANGCATLEVIRRPHVGVFSTGSELLSRVAPEEGRIFDANRPMLMELVRSTGAQVNDLGVVDDHPEATTRFFTANADRFDVLLSTGAVSAGGRDFIRPAFADAGGAIRAWKVALKPGKPALFGTLGRTAYFGLPGNPLAAFVCFELFVRDQLLRAGGAQELLERSEVAAIAGYAARRKTGRREYVPARIVSRSPEGLPIVEALGTGSSGTLYALARADGLAVIPADRDRVAPGDPVGFLGFGSRRARQTTGVWM